MQEAIDRFRTNLIRVRNLGSIVTALSSQTTGALDLTDILRAELVLSVSALDHYIHEVVRLGMLEAYQGIRLRTAQFQGFQVSLGSAIGMSSTLQSTQDTWIDEEIRSRNSFRSFQTPENIASAIRLISDVTLWDQVARHMNASTEQVKNRLRLIVDRRNKIAHEADMSPFPYQDRWPINRHMVTNAVDFLEQVVEAIHTVIT